MSLSSAAPAKKEEYPKFILKAESKLLGGNISISIVDEHEDTVQLAVTIFDSTGTKHFDSFSILTSAYNFKFWITEGILISELESMYLELLKLDHQKNKEEGESFHVH